LSVFKPYLASLAVYVALFGALWVVGWRRLRAVSSRRLLIWTAVGLGGVLAFLIVVGVTSRFRLLGRHCIPLLPVLLFPLGLGLAAAWERRGFVGKAAVAGFLALSLLGCLSLRFDPRHAKDDYRGAVAIAREALKRGEKVWWNAEGLAAVVYGLPVARKPARPDQVLLVEPYSKGFESNLETPDLVLTSKPDVYDIQGHMAEYLARAGFVQVESLPAFSIWRRRP
jgi:hypothetical protein